MATDTTRTRPRWRKFGRWAVIGASAVIALLLLLVGIGFKAYRIPSSSMEPVLRCARPSQGCRGTTDDRVVACRLCTHFGSPSRGEIVAFTTPPATVATCGESGTFIKRVIGLPGETVKEDDRGFIWIRGPDSPGFHKLSEPYISTRARELDASNRDEQWTVPDGSYLMMGDNRSESCDSRQFGSVARADLIGPVVFRYWPPSRIGSL